MWNYAGDVSYAYRIRRWGVPVAQRWNQRWENSEWQPAHCSSGHGKGGFEGGGLEVCCESCCGPRRKSEGLRWKAEGTGEGRESLPPSFPFYPVQAIGRLVGTSHIRGGVPMAPVSIICRTPRALLVCMRFLLESSRHITIHEDRETLTPQSRFLPFLQSISSLASPIGCFCWELTPPRTHDPEH